MRRRILGEGRISLKNAIVTCEGAIYNATRQIATNITVELDEETLVQDVDYIVTINSGGVDVGSYSVTVEGIEKYCDIATGTFTISKVTPTIISPVPNSLTYTSTELTLTSKGITNYGTLKYSLDNSTWDTEVPSAINAGTYIVYYKVEGNSNVNDVPTNSVSATINKVTPTVTAPTPKTLVYNGSNQVLANAGSTNYGTLQYCLNNSDGTYSTTIPSASQANITYKIWYKVVGDSNINDVAPASIDCFINEKDVTGTITLSQTVYTYNGSACQPTVTVKDGSTVIPSSEYTVSYSNNVNAGTATVTVTDKAGGDYHVGGSASFTINKASGIVSTAPTAKSLTYTGSNQALVNAGSGTGTMYYRLGTSGNFSTTIPSQTNAGSWTLYYYAAASTNYNQSSTGSITVSIGKANQSAPTATGATTTYPTTATASASGGGGVGSIEWSNGNTLTSVGSKTTYARWTGNGNYNASGWSNAVTLTMNKANRSISFTSRPTSLEIGSTGTVSATPSAGIGDGTITYRSTNTSIATVNGNTVTAVSVGTCGIKAIISGGTNYNDASYEYTLTVTYKKHNGYEYVDLGLPSGMKWARYNLGSSTEQGAGYYFSWCNTTGHAKGTSYNFNSATYAGTTGNNVQGQNMPQNSTYDPCVKNMGGNWHTPNDSAWTELFNNTNHEWTTIGGVSGMKLKHKNSASTYIFFPAAGAWFETVVYDNVGQVRCWASTTPNDSLNRPYYGYADSDGTCSGKYRDERWAGFSIRGVF